MLWDINSFGYLGKAIHVGDSVILKMGNDDDDIRFRVEVTLKKGNNYKGKVLEIRDPYPALRKYDIERNQTVNFCFNHVFEVKSNECLG